MTKGGLYHYINSKQDLLYRIVTLAMDLTFAEVVDKVRDIDDPEQQLTEVVRRHVDLTIGIRACSARCRKRSAR